jgi:hypothetical protein
MNNKPEKPQLNIPVVDGSFYWVRPFLGRDFEPAKAKYRYGGDELYFGFTDGSVMEVKRAWEVEPLFSQKDMENFAAKCMIFGHQGKTTSELLKDFCDNDR